MKRFATLMAGVLACSLAQAQSLREHELQQLLQQVAQQSNAGTPRAINADLLDEGYRVEGTDLVNHISVQPRHAAMMRDNPLEVRSQLAASVCANEGFRKLLARGAGLRYEFTEYQSERPIANERFAAGDCQL